MTVNYRVVANEDQIQNGLKTLKIILWRLICMYVIYTSIRFIRTSNLSNKHQFITSKKVKRKWQWIRKYVLYGFTYCSFLVSIFSIGKCGTSYGAESSFGNARCFSAAGWSLVVSGASAISKNKILSEQNSYFNIPI